MLSVRYIILFFVACGCVFLSAMFNIRMCMWGCPNTTFYFLLQASFYLVLGFVFLVLYFWVKNIKREKEIENKIPAEL